MTHAQTMRMIWIDGYLQTNAPLRRDDLMNAFGIAFGTATQDIAQFHKKWPQRIAYNAQGKYHHRRADSIAVFDNATRRSILDACAAIRNAATELDAA